MAGSKSPAVEGVGTAALLLGVVVMVGVSWWAYPHMVPEIVTRAAGGRHGRSTAGRGFAVVAMPLVAMASAVALRIGGRRNLGDVVMDQLGHSQDPVRRRVVLGVIGVGMAVLMTVLHVVVVSQFVA